MGDIRPIDKAWVGGLVIILVAFLLAGGTSEPTPDVRLGISLLSLIGILLSVWRLRRGVPNGLAGGGIVIGVLMLLLFAFQMTPLPVSVAGWLPGRAPFAVTLEAAGIKGLSSSLSLSPDATRASLLAVLPAVFMFLAALSVTPRHRGVIAGALVAFAVLSSLLGVAQRFSGTANWYLYEASGVGTATGFFANRNFFAALLYISIPMLGAFALAAVKDQKVPGWLAALLGLAYLAVILGGLAAAASRAGIILSMAAIVATAFLPWGSLNSLRTRTSRRVLLYAALTFMFIFSQFGLVGLLRIVETDPLTDYRAIISQVSWKAAWAMFPTGSGFGTFTSIYQMFETPPDLRPAYVNHAHNDWLEIVLEGGLPALFLLTAFLGWFAMASIRIWARRSEAPGDLVMTASSISAALLLLHSGVDYPLRTPALMSMLGLCLGFMAAAFSVKRRARQGFEFAASGLGSAPMARKPFTPFKPASETVEQVKQDD